MGNEVPRDDEENEVPRMMKWALIFSSLISGADFWRRPQTGATRPAPPDLHAKDELAIPCVDE